MLYCDGSVCREAEFNVVSNEELLELNVDVLVLAALENQITEQNADKIRAKHILEIANGPISPEANEVLKRKGINVLPDVLVNAGGVTVSYFEWVQNRSGFIKPSYSPELADIIERSSHAREWIGELQEKERARTGIGSLKVSYNKVHGYYIEVSKANTKLVPKEYERRQTLVNAERYITTELKEYESLVLNAEEQGRAMEAFGLKCRIEPGFGHMLPITQPALCEDFIRATAASLPT